MTTKDRVEKLIAEHLFVDRERVKPEVDLTNDLGADSLDAVELAMALEDEFGVTIDDDDIEKIVTVADATAYVEKRLP